MIFSQKSPFDEMLLKIQENSIDAGAKKIEIILGDSGVDRLKVCFFFKDIHLLRGFSIKKGKTGLLINVIRLKSRNVTMYK